MESVEAGNVSAVVEYPVLDAIRDRKGIRAFAPQLIEADKIASLFEAARWAPSSMNDQPWRYIYATKDEPEEWHRIFGTLSEGNRIWAKNAPLLIASFSKARFSLSNRENSFALYDLGAANALLAVQAAAMGLQVHQLAGYSSRALMDNLQIGEAYKPGVILAVGYPGNPDDLPEPLKQREFAPRRRKRQIQFVRNKIF
jgi:nitroreductase